jgi:TRAP-type C4-dicarboxylate transport system permease small subunit
MLLSIPFWGWNLVFPIAFGLITLRFLGIAADECSTLFRGAGSLRTKTGAPRP